MTLPDLVINSGGTDLSVLPESDQAVLLADVALEHAQHAAGVTRLPDGGQLDMLDAGIAGTRLPLA